MFSYSLTSESVCAGHPDKICDQISDAVLDEALRQDLHSHVAVETLVTKDLTVLAGEVTTKGALNYENIARRVIRKLGYTKEELAYTDKSPIMVKIHTQSPEIKIGVDNDGAGDQGIMYGYATDECANYMPLSITLAHGLTKGIDDARESATIPNLNPDGKAQVSVRYENGQPKAIESIVLAVPHEHELTLSDLKHALYRKVVLTLISEYGLSYPESKLIVNGTGVWHLGGPASDTGVTGRKIVVDTYGGIARVGGGAFSGKDPSKVDRSAAYAARFLAKNIVAHKLAKKCEVRLAYFIGAKEPVMLDIETFGTEKRSKSTLLKYMRELIDPSVSGIIRALDLLKPIYFRSAAYGHFGREGFPWEKIVN